MGYNCSCNIRLSSTHIVKVSISRSINPFCYSFFLVILVRVFSHDRLIIKKIIIRNSSNWLYCELRILYSSFFELFCRKLLLKQINIRKSVVDSSIAISRDSPGLFNIIPAAVNTLRCGYCLIKSCSLYISELYINLLTY